MGEWVVAMLAVLGFMATVAAVGSLIYRRREQKELAELTGKDQPIWDDAQRGAATVIFLVLAGLVIFYLAKVNGVR